MTLAADRGPKFRRRASARPDEVLDAALALFRERGFAATRVEDIGRRAGISKGAVYLYFASKEAIIEALVRRAAAPIADTALQFIEGVEGDPRQLLSMVFRMLAQRLSDPELLAIPSLVMREVASFPHLAVMYRREVLDRVIPVFVGVLERGMAAGYLRKVDAELTVRSMIGPIMLHIALAQVFDMRPADGLAMDRLVENHLTILFDGLAVPKPGGEPSHE